MMSAELAQDPIPAVKTSTPAAVKPARLVSLDAYRGLIMLYMASSGFGILQMARKFPDSAWSKWAWYVEHTEWIGCSTWDLIQPAFMFMVGVSLPYSYAKRRERGDSYGRLVGHAIVRALVLTALGVFLATGSQKQTNFLFTNVLSQIGLGYLFVFLLWGRGLVAQTLSIVGILAVYWGLFFFHPLPGPDFDFAKYDLKPGEILAGLHAHWTIHINFAADFDRWFLNLFPRAAPFVINPGGYQTLNFVPSIATMILGLMAGEFLRGAESPRRKFIRLMQAGAVCLVAGLVFSLICPLVKRIWTPSWALFSGGWVLWLLAGFFGVIDWWGKKAWAFPLVVVGMNSIAIYLMSHLIKSWLVGTLKSHFGQQIFSGVYGPVYEHLSVLAVLWLICWWLYRQKIFFRI